MLTSKTVTAEDAVQVTGESQFVRAANGRVLEALPGQWIITYAPGDLGVMDDGEYRRWFGA